MFNASKRGSASICRAFRATASTNRTVSIRPSVLSCSIRKPTKPALEARWIHISSRLRSQALAEARYDNEINQKDFPHITKFQELLDHDLVHPNVVDAITKDMGHTNMTDVQSLTINQGLQGTDIIAQARTGTGKTLGFLVPTIQRILQSEPDLAVRKRYSRARASDIRAIIISPTRELAEQIAVEAVKLTKHTDLIVQVAVGGNSKRAMLQKTRREGCHILVATPGRLRDLLSDEYSGVSAPNLKALVLDEADRLLDQGFSAEIDDIIGLLPNREQVDRQTMLYSATIPREVMHLVRRTLKPQFHFVQTVKEGELATHDRVPQKIITTPGIENQMPVLFELCKSEIEKHQRGEGKPFKAIIYFQSTSNVQLSSRVFENLIEGGGRYGRSALHPAYLGEIHGQLTQQQRSYVTEKFRRAESAILFSTDVTARGMDFPNVSHVIQVGLPTNREQYVHRIGRTGRAGKEGTGYLIIYEGQLLDARRMFRGLPITADKTFETAKVDMTQDAQLPAAAASILTQVGQATKQVDKRTKVMAYLAAIGQMNKGLDIDALNQWTKFGMGLEEPPSVPASTASKLGLGRKSGINIAERGSKSSFGFEDDDRSFQDRGFGGHRAGGDRFGGRGRGFGNDRGRGSGNDRGRGFGNDRRRDGSGGRGRGGDDRFTF